jgi:hypothetical protein
MKLNSFARPRQASTRNAIWVKVKKEMPRGRMMSPISQAVPITEFVLSRKKLAYLK